MLARGHWFTLNLGLVTVLTACGAAPDAADVDASSLSIREGRVVADTATGPERRSTVGLVVATQRGQFICSAAPLSPTLLVTAAHCVVDGGQMFAFTAIDATSIRARDELNQVEHAALHPRFPRTGDAEILPNDVAVLALSRPLPASVKVPPLAPASLTVEPGEEVLLAGYGESEAGRDSGTLRAVLATLSGIDEDGRLQIEDTRRRGACSGDSGGPLFVRRGAQWQLAGVLSGGPIPCRGENTYTNLARHADFVNATVASLGR
jgi:secreted trypsin-like serine protease